MTLAIYLILMAGVTYLIRAIPFAFFTKKIENRYIKSFLYYIPYAVLSAMTFPAILYSTGDKITAILGTLVALVLAFFNFSLTSSVITVYGLATVLFISNGKPLLCTACVRKILMAVVVSVPKSLKRLSALIFNASSTRT